MPGMSAFLSERKKTHSCGELRATDVGKRVVLMGWVHNRRDHGGCVFIDLRDRDGLTQVVFKPEVAQAAHTLAGDLRGEYCIGVEGVVESRGGNVNPKLATGSVELNAQVLEIFSKSDALPFPIDESGTETNEALRLQHRYLDLRRHALQKNFLVRSKIYQSTRSYLHGERFVELETPMMVKYTPGGARNFLVPSRLNPGSFYALAESPQIFKQLFMVSGFDRYFQIVKCFRDEDLRNDRQPEFTQIDIEMSFVTEEDVQKTMEGMLVQLWKDVLGVTIEPCFQRMPYDEAMLRFGSDKPDLRTDLELSDVTEAAATCGFQIFEKAVSGGGIVKALRIPEGERVSRSQLDKLNDFAKPFGAKGVAWVRVQPDLTWTGAGFTKSIKEESRAAMNAKIGAKPGDLVLFVADRYKVTNNTLGALRLQMARDLKILRTGEWRFLWVTDMPLFEQNDDGTWAAAHHPFTSPRLADLDYLESDPGRCRARAYDCVLNGNEIGGGSIRIHQREVQTKLFKALGLTEEQTREKFGFLLDAFKYGPPPHGGIAYGLDRLAMLMTGAESLRDVIAFPKTQKGTDLMTGAPNTVAKKQLDDLFVQVKAELPGK
jgi:aspartyl-tRNA synthetase